MSPIPSPQIEAVLPGDFPASDNPYVISERGLQRLLELADFVDKLPPDRFNIRRWFTSPKSDMTESPLKEPCGTTGCLLGWATELWPHHWSVAYYVSTHSSEWRMEPQPDGHGDIDIVPCLTSPAAISFTAATLYFALRNFEANYLFSNYKPMTAAEAAERLRVFVRLRREHHVENVISLVEQELEEKRTE